MLTGRTTKSASECFKSMHSLNLIWWYVSGGDEFDWADLIKGGTVVVLGYLGVVGDLVTIPVALTTVVFEELLVGFLVIASLVHLGAVTRVKKHYSTARFTSIRGQIAIWLSQALAGILIAGVLRTGISLLLTKPLVPTSILDEIVTLGLLGVLWMWFGWVTFSEVRENPSRTELQDEFGATVDRVSDLFERSQSAGLSQLERTETATTLEQLAKDADVVLTGPGGIGKSGIYTAVCESWDGPVLAINAQDLQGVPQHRSVADHLGLSTEPAEALSLIAQQDRVLMAIDQIDDLPDSPRREILEQLLIDADTIDNVQILLTARSARYEEEPFFDRVRSQLTLVEVPVTELSPSEVEMAFERMGVEHVTDGLQEICQKVINLSIVGRLTERGTVEFSPVTSEVALWHEFEKEVVRRGAPELTDEETPDIIQCARELSVRSFQSEPGNEFSVDDPRDPKVRVLTSWGVLQTGEDEFYRFSHPRYREYFYALDAVQKRTPATAIIEPLWRAQQAPIIRWVVALYIERDSSHLPIFLSEALADQSVPYRTRIAIIEEVAAAAPNTLSAQTLETLLKHVQPGDEYHDLFYTEIGGDFNTIPDADGTVRKERLQPEWLRILVNEKQFTALTRAQADFLLLHSAHFQDDVGQALKQLAPTDGKQYSQGLRVLSNVEFTDISPVDIVDEWVGLANTNDSIPVEAWRLFIRWVQNEDSTNAVLLLGRLVSAALSLGPKYAWPTSGLVEHQQAIERLARKSPNDLAPTLRESLLDDLRTKAENRGEHAELPTDSDELTIEARIWDISCSIEDFSLPLAHPRDTYQVRTMYLKWYQQALKAWIQTDPDDPDLTRELGRIIDVDLVPFNAVAAAVLSASPRQNPTAVHHLLTAPGLYENGAYHGYLQRLWEDGFKVLTSDERADLAVFLTNEAPDALRDARNVESSRAITALYAAIDDQILSTDVGALKRFRKARPSAETFASETDALPTTEELAGSSDLSHRISELNESLSSFALHGETSEQMKVARNVGTIVAGNLEDRHAEIPALADIDPIYIRQIVDSVIAKLRGCDSTADLSGMDEFLQTCASVASVSGPSADARYHAVRFVASVLCENATEIDPQHVASCINILSNGLTPPWGDIDSSEPLDSWYPVDFRHPFTSPRFQVTSVPACALAGTVYLLEQTVTTDLDAAKALLKKGLTVNDEALHRLTGSLLWRVHDTAPRLLDPLRDAFLSPTDEREWDPAAFAGWLSKPLGSFEDSPPIGVLVDTFPDIAAGYEKFTLYQLAALGEESGEQSANADILRMVGRHLFAVWAHGVEPLPPEQGVVREVFEAVLNSESPGLIVYVLGGVRRIAPVTAGRREKQAQLCELWDWHVSTTEEVPPGDTYSVYSDYLQWASRDESLPLSLVETPLRRTFPTISERPMDWQFTEELLATHVEDKTLLVIDLFHELTAYGVPYLTGQTSRTIIETGVERVFDERETELYEIADRLAEAGFTEIRDALPDS